MSLPELVSETLGDRAYDAIRDAILRGALEPGTRVTERGLATQLGVSATPVREALRRLEQDFLIQRVGPRAVEVVAPDDLIRRQSPTIEGALRALAARFAAEQATPDDIARMTAALDEADRMSLAAGRETPGYPEGLEELREVVVCLEGFHKAMHTATHCPVLIRMISMVEPFTLDRRTGSVNSLVATVRPDDADARYQQHRAILDRIIEGDADGAERIATEHARSGLAWA